MTSDNPRLLANWQPTSVSELIDGKPIDAPLRNMAPLAVRVPRLPVRPEAHPAPSSRVAGEGAPDGL